MNIKGNIMLEDDFFEEEDGSSGGPAYFSVVRTIL